MQVISACTKKINIRESIIFQGRGKNENLAEVFILAQQSKPNILFMSSKLTKRIVIGVLIVLIGIQFIRPDRKVRKVDPNSGFVALTATPPEMAQMIKTACYDCHSYETKYPWYANVAPISWWIDGQVKEAREHLNFSDWGKYTYRERFDKATEAGEEVFEGHMPDPSYTRMHRTARLTEAQRQTLASYFEEIKSAINTMPAMPQSMPTPPQ